MAASFTVIGSISSTTRKLVNNIRAWTQRHLIFEPKKVIQSCWWFKTNFIFTKWNVAVNAFWSVFSNKRKTYQDMVKLWMILFWEQYVLIFSVKIAYCVCLKRKTLCNCLCSSPSCDSARLFRNIGNLEQKLFYRPLNSWRNTRF